MISLGGLWLCLWRGNWRRWGIVAIAAGTATMLLTRPPDILIADSGRFVAARARDGHYFVSADKGEKIVLLDATDQPIVHGQALVTLDPNAEEGERQKCRIELLLPGMIVQQDIKSDQGTLLVSKGQEVTPPLILKLKTFHARRAIAGDVMVSMPASTTLAFGKGAL